MKPFKLSALEGVGLSKDAHQKRSIDSKNTGERNKSMSSSKTAWRITFNPGSYTENGTPSYFSKKLAADFLAAFAAFFSFGVKSGFFFSFFLLSCPLLMIRSS